MPRMPRQMLNHIGELSSRLCHGGRGLLRPVLAQATASFGPPLAQEVLLKANWGGDPSRDHLVKHHLCPSVPCGTHCPPRRHSLTQTWPLQRGYQEKYLGRKPRRVRRHASAALDVQNPGSCIEDKQMCSTAACPGGNPLGFP